MDTPQALLYGGVAAAVAVVQPEIAPFILLGAGILFFIFHVE